MELPLLVLAVFALKPVERFRTFGGNLPSVYLFLTFNVVGMFHALFPDSFLIRTTCKRFYCVSEGHIWLLVFVSELWVVISFWLIYYRLESCGFRSVFLSSHAKKFIFLSLIWCQKNDKSSFLTESCFPFTIVLSHRLVMFRVSCLSGRKAIYCWRSENLHNKSLTYVRSYNLFKNQCL